MLIKGTRCGDNLAGTDLADQIFGNGGNDVLYGSWGDDLVYGNAGNDQLYGDGGNDDLRGGQGDDVLVDSWHGADFLQGGKGNDVLEGNAIDYQRDTLHGSQGNDTIHGGTGFDLMIGGQGYDTIVGMGGEYYGDQGPGVRQTTFDYDTLASALGDDAGTPRIMTGGKGSDGFAIWAAPDGVATLVIITDWSNGQDHIQLSQQENYGLLWDMDTDANGWLDGNDGGNISGNYGGNVSVNDGNHSLTLTVGDGDSVTFLNTTHLDYIV